MVTVLKTFLLEVRKIKTNRDWQTCWKNYGHAKHRSLRGKYRYEYRVCGYNWQRGYCESCFITEMNQLSVLSSKVVSIVVPNDSNKNT